VPCASAAVSSSIISSHVFWKPSDWVWASIAERSLAARGADNVGVVFALARDSIRASSFADETQSSASCPCRRQSRAMLRAAGKW
jgi:hypothetical protein